MRTATLDAAGWLSIGALHVGRIARISRTMANLRPF